MRIIISVLLSVIFLLCIPYALGVGLEGLFDDKNCRCITRTVRSVVMGIAMMLALFQLVAVPMIIIGTSFHMLVIAWMALIVLCVAASVYLCNKSGFFAYKFDVKRWLGQLCEADVEQKILLCVVVLLIASEMCLMIFKTHMDTDDARFIAEALEAYEKNSLLRIHPITGELLNFPIGEMIKDVSSPYPIFIAAISTLTRIHPAVLAHAVFPPLLILLSYGVSYLIADFLFNDKRKVLYFMLILAVVILFSFESIYSWGYTLLAIIWQGRSIAAVIMLPLLWYVLMMFLSMDSYSKGYYLIILTVSMANANLSGMGWLMTPLIGGAFALAYLIIKRKIIPAIMIGVCVMPTVCYMILYELLR